MRLDRVAPDSGYGLDPGEEFDVLPEHVGSALMHAMIGAADAMGEPPIALLGDPGYYSQFGFVPSTDLDVTPPETGWGRHFQEPR